MFIELSTQTNISSVRSDTFLAWRSYELQLSVSAQGYKYFAPNGAET